MNVPSNWVSQARKAVKAWMGKSVTRSRVSSVRERNRARGRGEGCCLGSDRQENTRRGPSITFKDRRGVCTGVPRYPSGPQQHVAPLHGNYPADVSSLGRIGDSALGSPLPPVASHSFRAAGPVSSLPWRHCEHPRALRAGRSPLSQAFLPTPRLTSTERIFPKAKKRGCMLMSGSLRKQLGLAWCWKCMWFHQLAGAPYGKAGA